MKRITVRNFDDRSRTYLAAKRRKESGEQEMKELKDPFVVFLKKHGTFPPAGKKSLAYADALYRALASFGQSTQIDFDEAEKFRAEFNKRGRSVSLGEIFQTRTEYVVMPTALAAIERLPKKLQRQFKRVQSVKPKTPALTVERLQSEATAAA